MSTISAVLPAPPDNFSTTLSADVTSSAISIGLNDVTGLGAEGIGVIYTKDSNGAPDSTTIEFVHWTGVGANTVTLTDVGDRGVSGSYNGAQAHSNGDTFEVWVHSSYYPRTALLAVTTAAGALDTTKAVDLTTAQVLTNKDLTSGTNSFPTSVATLTGTQTFTNKRITKRVTSITSNANPTVNTDNCDVVDITAQAEAIASMTTNLSGTPTNKQLLEFEIKDDGTGRAITWGASFVAGGVALPTTTVASKILTVLFQYSTANSLNKWRCIGSLQEV